MNDSPRCSCAELRDLVRRLETAIAGLRAELESRPCAPPARPPLMLPHGTIRVTIGDVVDLVSREFGIPVVEILGRRRTAPVAQARQVACYVGTLLPGMGLVALGRHLGGLDHTTVMYARDRIGERLRLEPILAERVQRIVDAISPREPDVSPFATSNEGPKPGNPSLTEAHAGA